MTEAQRMRLAAIHMAGKSHVDVGGTRRVSESEKADMVLEFVDSDPIKMAAVTMIVNERKPELTQALRLAQEYVTYVLTAPSKKEEPKDEPKKKKFSRKKPAHSAPS